MPYAGRQPARQGGDGGLLEELVDGQLEVKALPDPGDHAGGEQRVPAELQEVVVDADRCDPQGLAPDLRHDPLGEEPLDLGAPGGQLLGHGGIQQIQIRPWELGDVGVAGRCRGGDDRSATR